LIRENGSSDRGRRIDPAQSFAAKSRLRPALLVLLDRAKALYSIDMEISQNFLTLDVSRHWPTLKMWCR
jgi:hypothetical protein